MRRLDTSYLRDPLDIWCWSDGTQIYLDWDNRAVERDGIPVWTATWGRVGLPVAQFIDSVRELDGALLSAMAARIAAIRAAGAGFHRRTDLADLTADQARRSTQLAKALETAQQRPPTNWNQILDRIQYIDSL